MSRESRNADSSIPHLKTKRGRAVDSMFSGRSPGQQKAHCWSCLELIRRFLLKNMIKLYVKKH